MGCGTSSPARLHPEPTAPAAPIPIHVTVVTTTTNGNAAVAPAPTSSPPGPSPAIRARVSSSSLSEDHDSAESLLPPDSHTQADCQTNHTSTLPPNATTSPDSGIVAPHPLNANHAHNTRSTPSPGAVAPRFSLNQRPQLALRTSNSAIGSSPSVTSTTSASPQPRLSLAAFPMTDEAKAKLERQRNKRHTNTDQHSFSLSPSTTTTTTTTTQQPALPTAAHSPMRASLSGFRESPLSPSRSQRLLTTQRLEYEADVVDGVPVIPPSPKSQREMRLSRHASGVGGGLGGVGGGESNSVSRLASARSVSRRVLDSDSVDGSSGIAPVSTTASEADGSDSDREAKDRMERRRTASTRGRLSQLHGPRELTVPQRDRRLHNLSADSTLLSSDDEDSRRRSLSHSAVQNADGPLPRRPRLHLRTTSRDLQAIEHAASPDTATPTAAVASPSAAGESPAAGGERRESVASTQRRTRRFTKTRHSNAFDGTELAQRMSRYDSTGQPLNASISQGEGGWDIATTNAAAGAAAEERDSCNHLQLPEQPAMSSSSSSSDGSLSPVRIPRGHVRSASSSTASMSSLAQARAKHRAAMGSSGSYNLAVPAAADIDRIRPSSQSLAVQQSTPQLTLSSPSLSPPLASASPASATSSYTSLPPSAPLSPATSASLASPSSSSSYRHQSRGKHLALLYCPPLSTLLLSVSLHKLGYHVLTADSGEAAVGMALQQRVDVVVVEWMDGEGVVVAAQIRAGEERAAGQQQQQEGGESEERTAVVVVCGDGADEDERLRVQQECMWAGCVGVMASGVAVLTTLPELLKKRVGNGVGCCWYVDGQSAITQIAATDS